VTGLLAWAITARLRFLLSSPYPWGVDGYWYAVQARSLLETGALAYPTPPLVPWLMALAARFTDPILGAKIVAAVGTALAVIPTYLLGRRMSGARAAGLLAAALMATAAGSFYLATEYVKEGIGVTGALAFAAALWWALEGSSRWRLVVPILLLLSCALTHKTSLALGVIMGSPLILQRARRARRRWMLLGFLLLSTLIVMGALSPRRFVGLADLRLFAELLSSRAQWSLPVLVHRDGTRLFFQHEAALAGIVALISLGVALVHRARIGGGEAPTVEPSPVVFPMAVLALILALPWLDVRNPDGLGYRLRLLAFVPLALLGAWAAHAVLRRIGARRGPLFLAAALALVVSRPVSRDGIVHTHPGLALVLRSFAGVVPQGATVIVPERRIAFMAVWYARVDARTRPSSRSSSATVFRLLPEGAILPALARLLDDPEAVPPGGAPPRELHYLPHGLVLLTEQTFQHLLERLPEAARAYYLRWPSR
jgi:hypothetical protein